MIAETIEGMIAETTAGMITEAIVVRVQTVHVMADLEIKVAAAIRAKGTNAIQNIKYLIKIMRLFQTRSLSKTSPPQPAKVKSGVFFHYMDRLSKCNSDRVRHVFSYILCFLIVLFIELFMACPSFRIYFGEICGATIC